MPFFYDSGTLIITILVIIGLILAIREIVAWYYKINQIVDTLSRQEEYQKLIFNKLVELNNRSKQTEQQSIQDKSEKDY